MAGANRASTPLPLASDHESQPAPQSVQVSAEPTALTAPSETATEPLGSLGLGAGPIAGGPIAGSRISAGSVLPGSSTMRVEDTFIPGPLTLHQEILRRLDSVEEALAALSIVRAGIGHNKPPEPIELADFDDRQAIEAATSIMRMLPAVPETPPDEARKAADQFVRIGTKTKAYAVKQGDNFISEIVKESAKATLTAAVATGGIGLSIGYVLYVLADRLMAVADAIEAWLDLLGSLH
jgi:hypothetical protein